MFYRIGVPELRSGLHSAALKSDKNKASAKDSCPGTTAALTKGKSGDLVTYQLFSYRRGSVVPP
jgi:hypothetical protein